MNHEERAQRLRERERAAPHFSRERRWARRAAQRAEAKALAQPGNFRLPVNVPLKVKDSGL